MTEDEIQGIIDPLLDKKAEAVRATIDAAACGTSRDFTAARRIHSEYADLYRATVRMLAEREP